MQDTKPSSQIKVEPSASNRTENSSIYGKSILDSINFNIFRYDFMERHVSNYDLHFSKFAWTESVVTGKHIRKTIVLYIFVTFQG